MINHNIPSMSLSQDDEGEIYLPSESNPITFSGDLRNFITLTRRAFNPAAIESLAEAEGIKVTENYAGVDTHPYVGLVFTMLPQRGTIEDFVQKNGDEFFDSLKQILATCTKRKMSGTRAVFLREFRKEDPSQPDALTTKIVLSTSIFYNDYRVTTGYPSDNEEYDEVIASIAKRIKEQWQYDIAFNIIGHANPYDDEDDDLF